MNQWHDEKPDLTGEPTLDPTRDATGRGAGDGIGTRDRHAASVTSTVGGVRIECGGCVGGDTDGTTACGDCFIGFLASREADDAVVFDVVEERALRLLREGGLLGTVVERRPLRRPRIA